MLMLFSLIGCQICLYLDFLDLIWTLLVLAWLSYLCVKVELLIFIVPDKISTFWLSQDNFHWRTIILIVINTYLAHSTLALLNEVVRKLDLAQFNLHGGGLLDFGGGLSYSECGVFRTCWGGVRLGRVAILFDLKALNGWIHAIYVIRRGIHTYVHVRRVNILLGKLDLLLHFWVE